MSEQFYRLLLGFLLWAALITSALYDSMVSIYILVGLMLVESLTNYRLSYLVSRIRYGSRYRRCFTINGKPCHGIDRCARCGTYAAPGNRAVCFGIVLCCVRSNLVFALVRGRYVTARRHHQHMSHVDVSTLGGVTLMRARFDVTRDWAKTWNGSIALKVTAVTI